VRSRQTGKNPFLDINDAPKSRHLPNTRLETFVFEVKDLKEYVSIQKMNGTKFITNDILNFDNYDFIQTVPSHFTGNSLGFIQWTSEPGKYASLLDETIQWSPKKPPYPHLKNIKWLDHAATRVKAQHRDAAILEFMSLTNYSFDFAIYVSSLNSITSVARLSSSDFAMVFTSGISPDLNDGAFGPTEKFIRNYGSRVHHIAFQTEQIEETYQALQNDGMKFLIELVGSPEEGLKQTFTEPSENTLLVTEYIHRYGDFQGFFTRSNVTLLTASTDRQ
jgi:4-hydroxyphenylpyruvate dioxygenase-like putative hemolysin